MAYEFLLSHPSILIIMVCYTIVGVIFIFWKRKEQEYIDELEEVVDNNFIFINSELNESTNQIS